MPTWTSENLRAYQARRSVPSPKPEPAICHDSLGAVTGKEKDTSRVQVRITSFRRRLLDADNVTPKYFIDCLRYCGAINDDRAQDIELIVRQVKVKTKAEERTEIEVG